MLGAMVTLTLGTATELGYSTEIKTDCPPIHTICAFPSGVYLGCLYVSNPGEFHRADGIAVVLKARYIFTCQCCVCVMIDDALAL